MDQSPLAKLPVELRLEIFEYVLYTPSEHGVPEWDDKGLKLPSWMTANNRRALTAVCQQIRTEIFPRFYRCHEIFFGPMILNKFQPGFFQTGDETGLQMIWNYLGSPRTWADKLSSWLDHLGPEVTQNVNIINVNIGTWQRTWESPENPLIIWVLEALAHVVRLFEGTRTQVHLCFLFEVGDWIGRRDGGPVSLPISDMTVAYQALDAFILKQRTEIGGFNYPRLQQIRQESLDQNHELLCTQLRHLEERIKGQTRG